ncbi:2-hydroxychromene-2-carboxylate isomerase [Salinarimonas ramus]|uniref:2-hydroxychromene-2-carboxylate isomerase n=1 Tax=Salinarimonas ramus TaxID=690164 RepID=A0A917Q517_9HYPH|nr:2-hydroxychromene-2-carboxylate isomerase [Salinarimonas ramus]GGK23333.1 2-hydroxychromene-2-carboxylate isomerase [Salinarimonas ramus]
MTRRPVLEFWFDFASTYAYLSAMRIEPLAEAAGVDVRYRPFLLGPIFQAQGWNTSPFNLYPAKGRYMWRDVAREAERRGLPFRRPDPFPQNGLAATRVALSGADKPWCGAFVRAVFHAEFGEGRSIEEPSAVAGLAGSVGLDPDQTMKAASAEPNKMRLRAITEEARTKGVFGAPTFFAEDGEMFWGDDRLERALAWAAGEDA